ncbi:hypothetical protein MTER_06710 [Mycolicibacter terrae]|jgi:hypothetical protein|uniref:Thioesterase n=1 Tax=Mycolicibacter terrae TaxID=1788 RepID=A0AAD1HUU8_9MYCO|nr:hypothetical protein [Mycolicibacter terrae]ORW90860.1 hypothetical protein AWC28_03490 [Mycolicibacter terrae]BBX21260.1 hypothetical protein MTER_06710 [Mycolicibacter terrae]SNV90670.1 Uncharacterised protein [Mycolicibacter terrae]
MADGSGISAVSAGGDRFGESPLEQTVAAAGAIRRVAGMLLALEHPHPVVDDMLERFADWERQLAAVAPAEPTPRLEPDSGGRVYLNHAFDVGAFNPCFPEYRFDHLDAETASGRVTFPLVYEGPPGLVHGGFLGVFFDCVIQHQSCAAGLAGRTRSLLVTYRRPTPILTELDFDIARTEFERGIASTARLLHGGEVLCIGEVTTAAMPPEQVSANRFGRRQPK